MTLPNNMSARDAIDRLKNWLASNPEIPRFRRRANKAAICRQAGIARSTADSNSEIRALFAGLDLQMLAVPYPTPAQEREQKSVLPKLASSTPGRCGWPAQSYRDSLAFEHLLETGRVVR